MKALLLVAMLLPGSLLAQASSQDVALLKKEYDLDCRAAIKPLALRYAAQLDALHRSALQAGDARKALQVEQEFAVLKASSGIDIPLSELPGAVHAKDAILPKLTGSWARDGSVLTLNENGTISAWWAKGHWSREPGKNFLTIKWATTRAERCSIDDGEKVIHDENGNSWTRVEGK